MQERRNTPRYPAVRYTAWIRRDNLFGKYRFFQAPVRNFNRQGLSFIGERKFAENDKLVLQICSASECVSGIRARVRHVQRQGHEYCIGVEFLPHKLSDKGSPNAGMDVLQILENLIRSGDNNDKH